MPKLWNETIEEHRRAVYDATLDATAALVAEHGLLGVTMSQIATKTGIGRATLYKYFPDVESILVAWHKRQIASHLDQLQLVVDRSNTPRARLEAVLTAYAQLSYAHADDELSAFLHSGPHVGEVEQHLHEVVRDVIAEAAQAGDVRTDITPEELTTYALHALSAAGQSQSKAATERLVELTLSGLQPR